MKINYPPHRLATSEGLLSQLIVEFVDCSVNKMYWIGQKFLSVFTENELSGFTNEILANPIFVCVCACSN